MISKLVRIGLLMTAVASTLEAQLSPVANSTLTLPAELPPNSGYTTENALGALTFSSPICITSPAGETNRLFVGDEPGRWPY